MKRSTVRITIVCVVLLLVVVAYYAYLSNKAQVKKAEANMTVVQTILSRNLKNDYPATPKEILKYYNEVMKCLYNEECTEEEIDQLSDQIRVLFDEELLEKNELVGYRQRLKAEIEEFHEKKRRIVTTAVAASTDVEKYEEDGFSFARLRCRYIFRTGSETQQTMYVYLLRRDEQKHWKIYGWKEDLMLEE